ncbi:MAG TPA: hybrid sensor histidine kinase/response regulator, partial [Abditibacterium sp.]
MHARMSAFDWTKTSIGTVENWPQSLKSVVKTLLSSQYPMVLTWGDDFIQFYNDAYSKLIGDKHPAALGLDIRITLAESWDILGPMIAQVMRSGLANWTPALPLLLERSGYREEAYFSVSHSPVEDDAGLVVGMLAVCSEVTAQVVGERRMGLLRDLGIRAAGVRSVAATCRHIIETLAQHPLDVPFALLYLREEGSSRLTCCTTIGLDKSWLQDLEVVDLHNSSPVEAPGSLAAPSDWNSRLKGALMQAGRGETLVLEGLEAVLELPSGPWNDHLGTARVMPLSAAGQNEPLGVLVAGVSPNRGLDENYLLFFELLRGQVAVAISTANAHEEERRRAQALAEIDRAKTEFFSNVSHEFRTPLTLILGPLEEVLQHPEAHLSAPVREQIEIANRNSLRLLKLVNTLLDFSRLEAGRAQPNLQLTDLASFTAELSSVFRSAIEKAKLRYVVNCPPLSAPVPIDRDMWEKIVLNLLSNAFKFTFEGEIVVEMCAVDNGVELSVRDSGTGIPETDVPHLFERFHRVRGAQSRSNEGSGIGLSLVCELVALHGGNVRVFSEMGRGTTFTVFIPLSPASTQAVLPFGSPPAPEATTIGSQAFVEEALRWLPETMAPGETSESLNRTENAKSGNQSSLPEWAVGTATRILLVDDNADMRDYVRRLLGDTYVIEMASNGREALDKALGEPLDLVLSDIMMPELDGFGLLAALRGDSRTADVPVI